MNDATGKLIQLALEEDLGSAGDITTNATIPPDAAGRAGFLAKEDIVAAGLEVASRVFREVDERCELHFSVSEGDCVRKGQVFGEVSGPYRALLTGERTALNFMQRLSGIATSARQAADMLRGTGCTILDTRKTTPGWRALEKAAVRIGGAKNHRFGLFDGILIKDNHIEAVGSIGEAVRRAREATHHLIRVEIEVETLEQVDEALAAGADVLMLDNMTDEMMANAVRRIGGRALTEASGGVRLERLKSIAATGVNFVSMGAITHSARAMDISLNIERD